MHKREIIDDRLPHADHDDCPPSSRGIRSRADTALDTGAFEHGFGREILVCAEQLADGFRVALRVEGGVDLVRNAAGDEVLRKG